MLAIILLIATPIILNVINDARLGAFASSKKNIERAAELYYASNSGKVKFENEVSYVEIGTLIEEGYLKEGVTNALTKSKLDTNTKILIYKSGRNIEFSLQMYDELFLNWYKEEMVKAAKKLKKEAPIEISLEELMNSKEVSELRLPIDLENRCVGYVEIIKENNKNEYQAYVDCLTEASSFASHYVSYGGKYLDEFNDVKETSDGGFIAVGRSNSEVITKYGTGNNGKYDAIIVKFNSKGEVEWSRNFGGSNDDVFNAVVEGPDGYVAVGQTSSNDGDITDYKGGDSDALIVAYDFKGNVIYKRSYGSGHLEGGTNGSENFYDILYDNNNYVIIGHVNGTSKTGDLEGNTEVVRSNEGIILKIDLNFNVIWRRFFVASNIEIFRKVIKSQDGNYIVTGSSSSNNYDMEGIGYSTSSYNTEAIIIKYDNNGNMIKKLSFKGSKSEYFYDISEISDGYIVIGKSQSNDYDMEDLSKANNGYFDAIIVKYDRNFNILWKKSFGGSNDDEFLGIEKQNDNEVVVVGYSKSIDMDMQNLSKSNEGYSNAIIVKYNANNGDIIDKRVFGGSNSERFSSIIKTKNNEYIISGITYSIDKDLRNFNKGHQDAILVSYDNNLNLVKNFQEAVVIIDKLKNLNSNYGIDITLKYNNIYTTNDPTKDLKNWCVSNEVYYEGNTSNYYYASCLTSFNEDDKKLLVEKIVGSGLPIYQGENEYNITIESDNPYSWHQLRVGNNGNDEYGNLKLKFADGYIGHITDAIYKGYIEPLVTVNSQVYTTRPASLLPNVIDIINQNGKTGISSYPVMYINFKPKRSKFTGLIITSSKNSTGSYNLQIHELRNFDMSITPTN